MYDRAHFAPGQVRLTQTAIDMIDRMAPVILENALQGHRVVVEGHADNVPMSPNSPFIDNWGLSAMRASAVVSHLVNEWNVPPEFISASGMGYSSPVDPDADNDSPEARSNNRRVEIKIYTELSPNTSSRPQINTGFQIPGL
jgi:chemotaxis protein MotB